MKFYKCTLIFIVFYILTGEKGDKGLIGARGPPGAIGDQVRVLKVV